MNVYRTFFYYTLWSNNDRFCLGIYNVVKPEPDTANFTKLFNYIKSNKGLLTIFDLKEIEKMEATIQSYESLINRIKVIRDQYIAHSQLKKEHLEGEATYTYEEGKQLLKELNKIINRLSLKYDNSRHTFEVSPSLNLQDMLRNLTAYRHDQIKRRREAVKQARTSYD